MQEREKLMQRGRELNEALEKAKREGNEGAARELAAELEKLKARHQAMEQEAHAIRERFGEREQPRPDGPPPADLERRLQHLRAAAENLRAAGMPDLAERLMSEAEQLARKLGGREGDRPREQPQPAGPAAGNEPDR